MTDVQISRDQIAGAVLLALLTLAFVGAFIQYLKGDDR